MTKNELLRLLREDPQIRAEILFIVVSQVDASAAGISESVKGKILNAMKSPLSPVIVGDRRGTP